MRWILPCAAAGALFFASLGAWASDATLLANRAGFLVGHAQRCGISDVRLERSAALVERLIAAFAIDRDDREAAESRFARSLVASAFAERLGEPVPPCALVRTELALLERHRSRRYGGNKLARNARSPTRPPRQGSKAAAKSTGLAATRGEELTPGRRAALELKRAAPQRRGRSPSI